MRGLLKYILLCLLVLSSAAVGVVLSDTDGSYSTVGYIAVALTSLYVFFVEKVDNAEKAELKHIEENIVLSLAAANLHLISAGYVRNENQVASLRVVEKIKYVEIYSLVYKTKKLIPFDLFSESQLDGNKCKIYFSSEFAVSIADYSENGFAYKKSK